LERFNFSPPSYSAPLQTFQLGALEFPEPWVSKTSVFAHPRPVVLYTHMHNSDNFKKPTQKSAERPIFASKLLTFDF
jgi:hypothetical protein